MAISAAASKVQKNFGAYHDRALAGEPVRVTRYGRETVYIISANAFRELKQRQRQPVLAAELTDTEMALIEAAEIPAAQRYRVVDEPT